MTTLTLVEMFTNPYDLEFMIGKNQEKDDVWELQATRGPEHNAKILFSGSGIASKDRAIAIIVQIIETAIHKGNEIICSDTKDEGRIFLEGVIKSGNYESEAMMNVINNQMVEQIKKDLYMEESCSTCTWLTLLQDKDTFAIALTGWENVLDKAKGKEESVEMVKRNEPRLTFEVAEEFIETINNYFASMS